MKVMTRRRKRKVIKGVLNIPRMIVFVITCVIGGIADTISLVVKLANNASIYRKCGYSPLDIMDKVKKMNSRQFEYFCAEIFRCQGYKVKVTQATNDYGRDIILTKDGETIFVECKHYKGFVGREICQKLLGSAQMFGIDKCIVITSGMFHKNAYEVQKMVGKDKLELIDDNGILEMLVDDCSDSLSRIMMKSLSA